MEVPPRFHIRGGVSIQCNCESSYILFWSWRCTHCVPGLSVCVCVRDQNLFYKSGTRNIFCERVRQSLSQTPTWLGHPHIMLKKEMTSERWKFIHPNLQYKRKKILQKTSRRHTSLALGVQRNEIPSCACQWQFCFELRFLLAALRLLIPKVDAVASQTKNQHGMDLSTEHNVLG